MSTNIPLRCACGAVEGVAVDVDPDHGSRVICYCNDCQAFARYLGRDGIVDRHGGTDIFQMTPSQVRITRGAEQLRVMRLSEKGLFRWFAGCCRTPVANTLGAAKAPFAAILQPFMDHRTDGRSRDSVLGSPFCLLYARFAVNGTPEGASFKFPFGLILRSVRLMAIAWVAGKYRPSPFFDAAGKRIVEPIVLTVEERDRLRPVPRAS
ncbi:MAG TPA: DUF6151 family protein [Polyangiaceae bacterium]|jgi:hypothetical protein|nr:DUF6151 family protein [Polyangiaceae bacterium]